MAAYRVQTDKKNTNVEDVSFKFLGQTIKIDLDKGASPREIVQTINFMKKQFFIRLRQTKDS